MIPYQIEDALRILSNTPKVLRQLLFQLPEPWVMNNEGADSWSPFDVVGHLVHGEKTDWILRTKMILEGAQEAFPPFDRFAQLEDSKGKSISQLLVEFELLREQNLKELQALNIEEPQFDKKGVHPALGEVNLQQLLSTWVAHDLGHIAQICRVMAKNYKEQSGPWQAYLRILND